jgi:hypothetical protein
MFPDLQPRILTQEHAAETLSVTHHPEKVHYSSVPDEENNRLLMLFSEETNLKPEILYP